jgi:hypothetical protein
MPARKTEEKKPEETPAGKPPVKESTPETPPAPAPPATNTTPAAPPEPVKRAKEWFDHLGLGFVKPLYTIPVSEPKPKE